MIVDVCPFCYFRAHDRCVEGGCRCATVAHSTAVEVWQPPALVVADLPYARPISDVGWTRYEDLPGAPPPGASPYVERRFIIHLRKV